MNEPIRADIEATVKENIEYHLDMARSELTQAAIEALKGSSNELANKYTYCAAQITREIETLDQIP